MIRTIIIHGQHNDALEGSKVTKLCTEKGKMCGGWVGVLTERLAWRHVYSRTSLSICPLDIFHDLLSQVSPHFLGIIYEFHTKKSTYQISDMNSLQLIFLFSSTNQTRESQNYHLNSIRQLTPLIHMPLFYAIAKHNANVHDVSVSTLR